MTEGFFGPLFFVWLGASLQVRELADHPEFIGLGIALGVGAVVAHCTGRLTGQPIPLGVLAAAQLGVPIAAATLGTEQNLLGPGEPSALILGAIVTSPSRQRRPRWPSGLRTAVTSVPRTRRRRRLRVGTYSGSRRAA